MKRSNEKHPVITLNDESFKHYLLERYGLGGELGSNAREQAIPQELWIRLYNRAKQDIEESGGRLMGYEVVDDVLVSHEAVHAQWPADWMWVMQFSHH